MINTYKHLLYSLYSNDKELSNIIANIDDFYSPFEQPKMKYGVVQMENGKPRMRVVTKVKDDLKHIQEKIVKILQQIEVPSYAHGAVSGRSNIMNARTHLNNTYFFNVDLKNFFPNISNRQVFEMYRYNKFSPTVSRILTRLTTHKGSLPQGAPTSPIIANLVFVPTGLQLQGIAGRNKITFTTFLDDLTFSCSSDFSSLHKEILQIIRSGGFCLNHKKITFRQKDPEVTGIILRGTKMTLNSIMKERAKKIEGVRVYLKRVEGR